MARGKVAPAEARGPSTLLLHDPSSVQGLPTRDSRAIGALLRHLSRHSYNVVVQPVVDFYGQLSWSTRHALTEAVELCMLLYIFQSVPFRVAFYFRLFETEGAEQPSCWSSELTVFAAADGVADLIGMWQFVQCYGMWKSSIVKLISSRKPESSKLFSNETELPDNELVIQRSSFRDRRPNKARWTIATIEEFAATNGALGQKENVWQKNMVPRNLEFTLELVAVVPVELIPCVLRKFNALHVVRISKLCRLYRLRCCLQRIIDIYSDRVWVQHLSSAGVDSLVRNVGLYVGLCHWVACGYMFIAHTQCGVSLEGCDEHAETSWVVRDQLFGATVTRKYGRTLYWASRTLVLLGYDDVTPVSTAETLYAVVVTIMGALFGSSLLANFLFLFRFRNARYAAYATHVDNAREYMRLQNIPRPLRHQVIAYFNYSWNTHHSLNSEKALHLMPRHLQSKVVSTLKTSRIKQVCFLAKESVEVLNLLALALSRRVYSPADQIIEPKTNTEMFFVIRGTVLLSAPNPKECTAGDFFADICLLHPEKYEQKVVAKTFCELYVLAKTKFDGALAEFYRGKEEQVRTHMADTFEKYSLQLLKMKKLLGLRDGRENGSSKNGSLLGAADSSNSSQRGASWRFPHSSFSAQWDAMRLVGIIYVAFEVPYFAVFISATQGKTLFIAQPEYGLHYVLSLLVETFFAVDLLLRSRFFAYLDETVMVNIDQAHLIFAHYKTNGFYLDVIAVLPAGLVLDALPIRMIQAYSAAVRLLRLLRVRLAPKLLRDIFEFYGQSSKLRLVVSLVLVVALMLHVVGCLWFQMTFDGQSDFGMSDAMVDLTRSECLQQATRFQNCSWVKFDCYSHIGTVFPRDNLDSTYVSSFAYLRSVYWAIVTLTGVGYGDIVAYSTSETYFAALWIFLSGVINFGVVGAMSSTISNVLSSHHHHMEKMNTLNAMLERMGISGKLSAEIRRFYHTQFTGRKQAYESQLLSNLPNQLCYEISSLLHFEAVKRVPLFESTSVEFLKEVTGKFRHKNYQNGEILCIEGDVCRAFFVLLHGSKLNLFFRSRKVPIRALHSGDCFGVNEFLLRRPYPATLTAASLVHASVMSRDQFDAIQRKFESDISNMKQEAESLLNADQSLLACVAANLEKLKLQSHLIQTPSLFYQRETAIIPSSQKQSRSNVTTWRTTFTSGWHAVIALWNLYNALFVIFRVCFYSQLHFGVNTAIAVMVVDIFCDACFAVDVYLRLYYFGNPEVDISNLRSRKKVDKHYLHSSRFKWDLLTSLPVYGPNGSRIACLCRLPRLIRCVDLWIYLDDIIVEIQQHFASRTVSAYLSPMKLMVVLILVAHYAGSIFFLVSEHECSRTDECWLDHDHLVEEYQSSVPILYGKVFYWAITTLLLVGSSEIVPRDAASTVWTGFTCLCCTFIIGHIVGEISELILELGKEEKQYKSRIANFDRFAKVHDLPVTLRERVTFFFREQFEHTKGLDMGSVVHDLSANLRLKLMLEIYGNSIVNLPFRRFLTASQVNNLTLRLQSEFFIPGDNILVEGTSGNRLCVLRKGIAAVYWTKSSSSVAMLMEGACFGEIAFFLPNQQRLATVQSITFCEVLFVSKTEWQQLWVATGDSSDSQVQRHALHAILGWVSSRLQRYQHVNLRIASRARRILLARTGANSMHSSNESSTTTGMKTRAKLLTSVLKFKMKETNGIVRAGTPPLKSPKAEARTFFMSPQIQILEKKTEYLLKKSDECATKFGEDIATIQTRRTSVLSSITNTIGISLRSRHSTSRAVSRTSGGRNSTNLDTSILIRDGGISKANDIRLLQFIVHLNPVNKHVRDTLGKPGIRALEVECWARWRILAEAQHAVAKLLDIILPPETGIAVRRTRIGSALGRKSYRRQRSYIRSKSKLQWGLDALDMAVGNTPTKGADRKKSPDSRVSNANLAITRRRFSGLNSPAKISHQCSAPALNSGRVTAPMIRCHSLPARTNDALSASSWNHLPGHTKKTHPGIDFNIIMRCQRPQYATQLNWYRRYVQWKYNRLSSIVPEESNTLSPKKSRSHLFSLTGDMIVPAFHRLGRSRIAAMGSKLRLPSQRTLLTAATDVNTKQFIKRVKEVGKIWDLVMLTVSAYHSIVIPFKVCFSSALVEVPVNTLSRWSAFESFLDVLCVADVGYRIRIISIPYSRLNSAMTSFSTTRFGKLLATNSGLFIDLVAMLPLELLLFAAPVRLSIITKHSTTEASQASWWATRWFLRINRLLLIRRINPLSEQLFQYVIHDLKTPVSEPLLYFLRGLTSYLAMGHVLACIWFISSDLAFYQYGTSWLSTSGMLTYISSGSGSTEARRVLSEIASSFRIETVSLSRKYVRSLLFSMECISTLFYGDILSMNPLELVAEIAITFWSIYIYGALVGTQAELLDTSARREAAFEQTLGELHHYVIQNGVPKVLKQQIKAYYAWLWRRSRGEDELAAIASISRVLYEDVVLTMLCHFATQVKAFRKMDEHFLRRLLVCLQFVLCSEGEQVIMKGDVDRSMYFISRGRIMVTVDSSEVIRERGEHFGELTLLYGISRLETCVALTVVELYRLDHEPYEKLLLEFPDYRMRNKLAWTSLSASEEVEIKAQLEAMQREHTTLASRPSIARVGPANNFNVESRIPFSFVHQSGMKMLAQLQTLHPVEAKALIVKFREGARKQLLRSVVGDEQPTSESNEGPKSGIGVVDVVRPDIKLLRVLKKTRAMRDG